MFESLTFLSVLSAAPAVLKFAHDAVEFYGRVKALRSPKPARPLIDADSFTKVEKRELDAMYAAIDASRPIVADIATRAFRFYLTAAGLIVAVLVIASLSLMWIPAGRLLIGCVVAILVGGAALIAWFPYRLPNVLKVSNTAYLKHATDEILESLRNLTSGAQVWFGTGGVSIPERMFLETYLKAQAIVRVLECNLWTGKLTKSIQTAHETLTGRVFNTGVDIVMDLANDGQLDDPQRRKAVLSTEFRQVGLDDLVKTELVGEHFFTVDFRALAKSRKEMERHLKGFWSS